MRRILRLLPLFVVCGLAAAPLWASAQQDAVLGANGEVYSAKEGTYGELFPAGKDVDPSYPVLALEITQPDGARQRLLVDGTEGPGQDNLPFLVYEESSRTVFLLWETRFNGVHPMLMLAGYSGSWMAPVEIVGNPFAAKTSPQLAITRDTVEQTGSDGAPVTLRRTVLHLVWGEETSDGTVEAFYMPVVLDDGVLTGHNTVFRLGDFDKSDVAAGEVSPELEQALAITRGRDERTVVAAFSSTRSHRLVTVEIDALPAQLSRLADEARMHIIEIGAKHSYPAGYKQVADLARMHIIEIGVKGYQSEVAQAMAQQVSTLILENKGGDALSVIADRARMHIIEIGARLSDRGLRSSASASTVQIKEVAGQGTQDGPAAPLHLLGFRLAATWPAPETGGQPVRYFPARSGRDLLVAWADQGKVKYRETQDGEWNAVKEIALSSSVDVERAYQILEERMNRN